MQAQPNDALSVSTVLVSDREQFRTMVLHRLAKAAGRMYWTATTAANRQRSNGVLKIHERYLATELEELDACRELLGQIGWRD